ncbi:MAG: hypothetical protein DRI54_07890 [Bacteroidetes bacterium]|nr:MAG: hypothetical protein DRI54_07890 [Bacteroidota bacterium]
MKNLLAILLICFSAISYTQTPLVFINQDATWNVARTFPDANPDNPSFVATTTTVYGFSGDTLIDNELWDKYYFTSDSNFVEGLTYVGCMQETDGIVVFMDTTNTVDTLYNFNLQQGDSVFYDFGFDGIFLKIETIDSIEIEEQFYKRFYFDEPIFGFFYIKEIWIEGIGSTHGPLFPAYPMIFSDEIPDSLNLTCYNIENQVIWNNPNYGACYINIVLSIDELTILSFKIYPNPAKNEIFISSNNGTEIDEVNIYNQLGQNVIHQNHYNRSLDVSSLMPGIYFVEVVVGNDRIREKLVIN